MATKLTAGKRQSYTVSNKLRIIQFAEQNSNRAAERVFGVSESNVRLWWKSKENLEKMPWLKRANRGKKAAWPELEVDLLSWITEKTNNVLAILPSLVQLKALELAKEEKYTAFPKEISKLEITGVNVLCQFGNNNNFLQNSVVCKQSFRFHLSDHCPRILWLES